MTDSIDIDYLRQWVGRQDQGCDVITTEQVRAIAATLDHDRFPNEGDALPPLWHWAFFRPTARARDIGPDGHPKLGGFMPPVPLPRRMWVGGDLRFHGQIKIGAPVTRETTITDVTAKSGKGGALVFLTLTHKIYAADSLAVEEIQNIVYREAAVPNQTASASAVPLQAVPMPREREAAAWCDPLTPDPVLLLRYSALTFNAHRIHYDADYASRAEGYPGLVVHGPLTATLLADRLILRHGPALKRFAFRARQPLFCNQPLAICGDRSEAGFDLWAETPSGAIAMSAEAEY